VASEGFPEGADIIGRENDPHGDEGSRKPYQIDLITIRQQLIEEGARGWADGLNSGIRVSS
jgi:hypothetical protein